MSARNNIDRILREWPYDPEDVHVRMVQGDDKRRVLQMRVDLGVLQLEVAGRPDGTRPYGFETMYDYLSDCRRKDAEFVLAEEFYDEVDREFVQYYHRRMCWLRLREFPKAVADADYTLNLMDLCAEVSDDEQWTISHEQYRPFVLFHRTQAAAMAELEVPSPAPEKAVDHLNQGLDRMRDFFVEHDAEEFFEEDDLVVRLTELRDNVRSHFQVGRTLHEQLAEAVAAEEFELAARIRDELARQKPAKRRS